MLSTNFQQISLINHIVYVFSIREGKTEFTCFQKSPNSNPISGTGKSFFRKFDLLNHLSRVNPDEKKLFERTYQTPNTAKRATKTKAKARTPR